jgi:hypothetical protein
MQATRQIFQTTKFAADFLHLRLESHHRLPPVTLLFKGFTASYCGVFEAALMLKRMLSLSASFPSVSSTKGGGSYTHVSSRQGLRRKFLASQQGALLALNSTPANRLGSFGGSGFYPIRDRVTSPSSARNARRTRIESAELRSAGFTGTIPNRNPIEL